MDILADVLQISPEERLAYVAQVCAFDAVLLAEVQSLLTFADDGQDSLNDDAIMRGRGRLESLLSDSALSETGETPSVADRFHRFSAANGLPAVPNIPGYEIDHVIASGGMGTVYAAHQTRPRRTVAIKVMRPGVASPAGLRRFEHEAQVLAHLRHPGIAQVYEADTFTSDGVELPYFVMEHIPDALTLTEYAERNRLGIIERLELFAQVCDAIHHGHQKGIIHRDIKPSNVLVDANGCAKVIDFGVARSTDADLTVTTIQTEAGQLIGTLQYMSPEQVSMESHDIDTRSDVYALGVVAYELQCSKLPYDLRGRAIHEASRIIREQTPTRPGVLDPRLRGDVETIIMKSLEKDRDRRYASVAEMHQDVLRCLHGELINARPPSLIYQLRALARRHRGLAYGVLTALTALVVSSIVVTVLYLQTSSALNAESEQRREAIDARDEAEAQRTIANREVRISNAINEFLQHDLLAAADPKAIGREVTVAESLDIASQKISSRFADQPDVEASIRTTLGTTYEGLGKLDAALRELKVAVPLAEQAYGLHHAETIRALGQLAYIYRVRGDTSEAEAVLQRAIKVCGQAYGELDHRTLEMQSSLSLLYRDAGRFDEAESLGKQILDNSSKTLGPDHSGTIAALNNLSYIYQATGRFDEAEPLALKALNCMVAKNGELHPTTLTGLSNVAWLLMKQGKLPHAEMLHRQALAGKLRLLGPEHAETVSGLHGLAECLRQLGRFEEAAALLQDAEVAAHRAWPADSWLVSGVQAMYGDVLIQLERYDEAEVMLIKAFERLEPTFGNDHQLSRIIVESLIGLYEITDRPAQADIWKSKKIPAVDSR
jgi:non-specific serine/threonine protein kinase/serine/threonine-protein kinase